MFIMKKWHQKEVAQDSEILTEFFTVNKNALPKKVYKYNVEILKGTEKNTLCGKLSYFLKNKKGGQWIWVKEIDALISDKKLNDSEIESALSEIKDAVNKNEKYKIFMGLKNIEYSEETPLKEPLVVSYFARDLINDILRKMRRDHKGIFIKHLKSNPMIIVERSPSCRAWNVMDIAVISLSIESHIIFKESVSSFIKNHNIDPEELIELPVRVPGSNHTGTIVEYVGKLDEEERQRLMLYAEKEETKEKIRNAPENDFVFGITFKNSPQTYEYVGSAIYFSPTLDVLANVFPRWDVHVDMREVSNKLKISPSDRYNAVKKLADMMAKYTRYRILGEQISSNTYNSLFYSAIDLNYPPTIEFGRASGKPKVVKYGDVNLWKALMTHKIYSIDEKFKDSGVIRTLVVYSLQNKNLSHIKEFIDNVANHVKSISTLDMSVEDIVYLENNYVSMRINLSSYIARYNPDMIIGIFPGSPTYEEDRSYEIFKEVTLGKGIASQFIYEETLNNPYAVRNIALGILGKTGNIPYILHNPPDYADFIVGIDISRKEKMKAPGSVNVAAVARVYFADGRLFKYTIKDSKIEGETLEAKLLEEIFVDSDFENKRIVIHRDGYFRGNEVDHLDEIAEQLGSKFYYVEIIKRHVPRLYRKMDHDIVNPEKGDVLIISPSEAIISTSQIDYKGATAAPIRIRVRSSHRDFDLKKALNSVLNLTVLHYGSIKQPKVPVTIHYSDKIAKLALKGIKPQKYEGNIPYWL